MIRCKTFPSEEFLAERLDIAPGEHVGVWGPTGTGKTDFTYRMLGATMSRYPDLRYASMMPKPADPATRRWSSALDMKITDRWPPPRPFFSEPPAGHVFWPRHLKGVPIKRNREYLAERFRLLINDQYRHGNSVTFADDVYLLAALLDLNPELEEIWTAGQGLGASIWSTNQKPSGTIGGGHVSSFSYNAPTHYIFSQDPDARNRRRFSEIGASIDPDVIAYEVANLRTFRIRTPEGLIKNISEKLYLHKGGPWMCKVLP
jgi:energy-coupling factor transporter ATP-binding protein EcfA2